MRSKQYCIKVTPIAWKRAGRNGNRYFDFQAREKLTLGICLNNQQGSDPLFSQAIHMDIVFYMPIPRLLKDREKLPYHTKTPDADNLCKLLFDALKGVVIQDDKLIFSYSVKKMYDKDPRTEFTITEVV